MGKKIKIPLGSRAPKAGKSIKSMKGALKGALKGSSMKRPQKGPTKPTKSVKPIQQKRRDSSSSSSSLSSALNLSDDDGYSAVEDVPDSDDDEEHVFAVEEEHIILREKHRKKDVPPSPPRPISDPEDEDAADADDDDSDDDMSDQAAFIDEELSFDDASSTASSGREIFFDNLPPLYSTSMDEQSQTPVERHVRFAGVPDSDSDSDETEDDHDDVFPDIFIPQSALEPNFRREIEQDDDDGDSYSSDTFWDYTNGAEFEDDGDMDPEPNDMNMLSTDQIMPELSNLFGNSQLNAGDNGRHQSGVSGAPSPKEEDASSDGYECKLPPNHVLLPPGEANRCRQLMVRQLRRTNLFLFLAKKPPLPPVQHRKKPPLRQMLTEPRGLTRANRRLAASSLAREGNLSVFSTRLLER